MLRLKNFTYAYGNGEEEELELERIQSMHESYTMLRSAEASKMSSNNSNRPNDCSRR